MLINYSSFPAPQPLLTIILLSVSEFEYSRYLTGVESRSICSFCDSLMSLSVKSSRLIRVAACGRISLLVKAEYYSVCVYHVLFTRSSVVDTWIASTSWLL